MRKLLFLALLCIPFIGISQDTSYARSVISRLTAPDFYGRSCAHGGDSMAAEYLRAEMRAIGLRPLANNYWQTVYYDVYDVDSCELTIDGRHFEPYKEFRVYSAKRYATGDRLKKARHKKQIDGIWYIGKEKLDTYSPVAGEYSRTPYCVEILDSLFPRKFKKVDNNIDLIHNSSYKSQNIMGFIKGEVDTMIVFIAHYDHCGTMGSQVYFPGAHDNASGVAAVLDIARMKARTNPHYTLVFMLMCGEEAGLKGSMEAANNPPIDLKKVKLLINIDLFCGGEDGLMVFNANANNTKSWIDRLETINNKWQLAPTIKRRDNSPNSDHYHFSGKCPSVYILSLGQPYGGYHDPDDTCERCGLQYYSNNLRLILAMLGMDFNLDK